MIVIRKASSLALAMLGTYFALFSPSALLLSQASRIHVDFRGNTLSADIEDAVLRDVLDRIKEKRGICFNARLRGKAILDEKVSLYFKEQSGAGTPSGHDSLSESRR